MTWQELSQEVARVDRLSNLDSCRHGLVGGTEAADMIDADHAAAGHLARERHRSRPGRADVLPRRAGKIDSTMPRQPGTGWRIETPHHLRRAGEW
jgi:hypothetical protein